MMAMARVFCWSLRGTAKEASLTNVCETNATPVGPREKEKERDRERMQYNPQKEPKEKMKRRCEERKNKKGEGETKDAKTTGLNVRR